MPVQPKKEVKLMALAANFAETIILVHTRMLDITPEYVKPKKAANKYIPRGVEMCGNQTTDTVWPMDISM